MQVLNEKDYKLFEKLVSLPQRQVKQVMTNFLKKRYEKVIVHKDYLVAIGDVPIALVAHMDTVFKSPVSDLYYDKTKNVMWSPDGLGADDRAGVYAIIKILQDGYRPSVILTTDEEKGGLGASSLAETDCPIPGLKYMIELDRRGTNDCVFYDCFNNDFVEYVESFGFIEQWGSFSDISFLMGAWNICGVNLSVGYRNEHSTSETLHITDLQQTINKVKIMLEETDIPNFEYIDFSYEYANAWKNYPSESGYAYGKIYGQHCSKCKTLHSEYELFPAKTASGLIKYFCPDCIVGNVEWCEYCGEAFEVCNTAAEKICKECMSALCIPTSKNSSNQ